MTIMSKLIQVLLGISVPSLVYASGVDSLKYDRLEAIYKDLHKHPELSFKEKRTAAKIKSEFKRLGLETFEIGGGVVEEGYRQNSGAGRIADQWVR